MLKPSVSHVYLLEVSDRATSTRILLQTQFQAHFPACLSPVPSHPTRYPSFFRISAAFFHSIHSKRPQNAGKVRGRDGRGYAPPSTPDLFLFHPKRMFSFNRYKVFIDSRHLKRETSGTSLPLSRNRCPFSSVITIKAFFSSGKLNCIAPSRRVY